MKRDQSADGVGDILTNGVNSWLACSQICQEDPTCKAWNYVPKDNRCVRKLSFIEFQTFNGYIAGERDCPNIKKVIILNV